MLGGLASLLGDWLWSAGAGCSHRPSTESALPKPSVPAPLPLLPLACHSLPCMQLTAGMGWVDSLPPVDLDGTINAGVFLYIARWRARREGGCDGVRGVMGGGLTTALHRGWVWQRSITGGQASNTIN